jgi:hypothetical protein
MLRSLNLRKLGIEATPPASNFKVFPLDFQLLSCNRVKKGAMDSVEQVRNAANLLVDHFGSGRVKEYFACFAPDADFIFYTHPERLASRAAYEALWKSWETDFGFKVNSCKSSNQAIKIVNNNLAIFTHDVTTSITNNDGTEIVKERETIVFSLAGDRWVAIHEHLSPAS